MLAHNGEKPRHRGITLLATDPNATIKVTVEIDAEFPNGVADAIKRAVSQNAHDLGFEAKDWE